MPDLPLQPGYREGVEAAANVAKNFYAPAHARTTYATDVYRAQDETCRDIADAILALLPQPAKPDRAPATDHVSGHELFDAVILDAGEKT